MKKGFILACIAIVTMAVTMSFKRLYTATVCGISTVEAAAATGEFGVSLAYNTYGATSARYELSHGPNPATGICVTVYWDVPVAQALKGEEEKKMKQEISDYVSKQIKKK